MDPLGKELKTLYHRGRMYYAIEVPQCSTVISVLGYSQRVQNVGNQGFLDEEP